MLAAGEAGGLGREGGECRGRRGAATVQGAGQRGGERLHAPRALDAPRTSRLAEQQGAEQRGEQEGPRMLTEALVPRAARPCGHRKAPPEQGHGQQGQALATPSRDRLERGNVVGLCGRAGAAHLRGRRARKTSARRPMARTLESRTRNRTHPNTAERRTCRRTAHGTDRLGPFLVHWKGHPAELSVIIEQDC